MFFKDDNRKAFKDAGYPILGIPVPEEEDLR